jgi:hypothetical protein
MEKNILPVRRILEQSNYRHRHCSLKNGEFGKGKILSHDTLVMI